jgi:2-amino-4-hydroxy-6-hydroxymethyldihydropteridine diphosphokinase
MSWVSRICDIIRHKNRRIQEQMRVPDLSEGKEKRNICFIGIGSNIGDPLSNCLDAIENVVSLEQITLTKQSALYKTEPVGFRDQDWFINGVIEVKTSCSPRTLLEALKVIEYEMGRKEGQRWGPRVIDLDILFYGQEIIDEEGLVIPHPELHKRGFVLIPLNEIAPYVIHPAFGVSVRGLLGRLEDKNEVSPVDIGKYRDRILA